MEDLEPHFKVPFTSVLDLVASRSVFLHHGFTFVPASAVGSLLKHRLEEIIMEGRPMAKVAFAKMKNDDRFTQMINHVTKEINKITECSSSTQLPPTIALNMAALPDIAEKSFPWCMVQYHHKVSAKLRIDYPGWLQYTSFLKDAGANVGEVMEYWREYYQALGRTNSEIRKIGYDVRHLFGLEGHRKEFQSFSCRKIIASTDQIHGCPYRSVTADVLIERLTKLGLSSNEIATVTERDNRDHCQLV